MYISLLIAISPSAKPTLLERARPRQRTANRKFASVGTLLDGRRWRLPLAPCSEQPAPLSLYCQGSMV